MENTNRKLKLNVKGRIKKLWGTPLLKSRAYTAGVAVDEIRHPSSCHVEMHLSGEMDNLWKVINWSKRGYLFFSMHEVLVEFKD
jgi:hypothetical protein